MKTTITKRQAEQILNANPRIKEKIDRDIEKERKMEEMQNNLDIIYNKISDLRDYVSDSDYIEREYILEELQNMQQYAK